MPNLDRLRKMVEILQTAEANGLELDMASWRRSIARGYCGTVCCAVGWYCTLGDSDLVLKPWEAMGDMAPDVPSLEGEGLQAWGAVETHFGLTQEQAEYLFTIYDGEEEPSYGRVIRRIQRFINEQEKEIDNANA